MKLVDIVETHTPSADQKQCKHDFKVYDNKRGLTVHECQKCGYVKEEDSTSEGDE